MQDHNQSLNLSISSRDEVIRAYTIAGHTLFPCRDKKPLYKGWPDTIYSANLDPHTLPASYAVNLQDTDFVIDVDPRRYAGTNQLDEFLTLLKIPKPIDTFIVKTGGGGLHIYFKKPPGIKLLTNADMAKRGFPAIEFKARGRYVIGAGSVLSDGATYSVARREPGYIMQAPDSLLRWAEKEVQEFNQDELKQDIVDLDSATLSRAILVCENATPAIEGQNGDDWTFNTARQLKKYGLSESIAFEVMAAHYNPRCQPLWSEQELAQKVKNAYQYSKVKQGSESGKAMFNDVVNEVEDIADERHSLFWDTQMDKQGKITYFNTQNNVFNYFRVDKVNYIAELDAPNKLKNLVAYNAFSNKIEFKRPAPWHDVEFPSYEWVHEHDTNLLQLFFRQHQNFKVTEKIAQAGMISAALKRKHHPVRKWLKSLQWDMHPRLDTFLTEYAGVADTVYTQAVGTATMIGIVKRVMEPGCQHDYILVLEGKQGIGKSSFVRVLGGEYYADIIIDPHDKDTAQALQGKWIIEASEMDYVSKSEITAQRAFITRTIDRFRPSFSPTTRDFPRQCVFIGTVNPNATHTYLTDPEGNRRYWPVVVGRIDLPALQRDRDQLFAEAYYRYLDGEANHLVNPESIKMAIEEQSGRLVEDLWEETIIKWVNQQYGYFQEPLTTSYIANTALGISTDRLNRAHQMRTATIMKKLGFSRTQKRINGDRLWIWEQDPDHIQTDEQTPMF